VHLLRCCRLALQSWLWHAWSGLQQTHVMALLEQPWLSQCSVELLLRGLGVVTQSAAGCSWHWQQLTWHRRQLTWHWRQLTLHGHLCACCQQEP
jgi:hypothetical protein